MAVQAKVVVLAANACESARLLLNSKSSRFPQGLANSSGVIGKYLNDSTGASRGAFVPALMDRKRYNEDGVGGMHVSRPGGWIIKNLIFRAVTTLNIGVAWAYRLTGSAPVLKT